MMTSNRIVLSLILVLAVLANSCGTARAGGGTGGDISPPPPPPMGWSSWYAFYGHVTDAEVRAQADLLVSTGLRDAGYVYVNIDDGWAGFRDSSGVIHPNSNFPDMKALGDYLHSRGLKFGIYSSPGPTTCLGLPGSLGYEQQDADTFASWGVDFLKYDWCSLYAVRQPDEATYRFMYDALHATGRKIALSISEIGENQEWTWGAAAGGIMWRTDHDLGWIQGWPAGLTARERAEAVAQHVQTLAPFSSPGHYNDPDYLLIGIRRYCLDNPACSQWYDDPMTIDDERWQFNTWKQLRAPLLISCDISQLTPDEIGVLKGN